jgi:hypothetical protein
MQAIFRMENLINRKLDVTRHYVSWDRDLANDQVRQSAATGHIPLVSLECQRSDGSFIKWADIAGGRHDTELTAKAHGLRDWGKHAYFVFNHEPENDIGSGNAEAFRAAYNHTRQLFGASGATNLRWVCTLMAPTYGGAHGGAKKWVCRLPPRSSAPTATTAGAAPTRLGRHSRRSSEEPIATRRAITGHS